MTPHPSHNMGLEDGEPCCLVCYAAPWMAVVEQPCDTSCVSSYELRAIRHGRPKRPAEVVPQMTVEQVLEAKRWRDDERTWTWIALRMGRPVKSLQRAVRMLERGEGRIAEKVRRQAG